MIFSNSTHDPVEAIKELRTRLQSMESIPYVANSADDTSLHAPTVSVVVPSFNHAGFVASCLRSIIKQTLAPTELLVIDDGSSDDSPKVIERVLQSCPFPCEAVVREHRGLSATLNEGLARTRGEYFAYLGSDDVWLPDFLAARVKLLRSQPQAVLGYGHAYLIDEQNNIIDCTNAWSNYMHGNVQNMLLEPIAPMSPTVMYAREAVAHYGWNELARLEDYELYLRLSSEGDFAFDASVLSAWRWHKENTSWDQSMMLQEQLAAQRRVMSQLHISEAQLIKLQRRVKFNRAEDFLRLGQKSSALALMLQNLRGANSPLTTTRMLMRLLIPNQMMHSLRQRQQRKNSKRYGVIHI